MRRQVLEQIVVDELMEIDGGPGVASHGIAAGETGLDRLVVGNRFR